MRNPLDWKAVGQFLAVLVNFCTLVRATFTELKVGIEILPWLLDEGKDSFVEKFLKPLGQEFLETHRIRVVDSNTIEVNLGISPKLPFEGAMVVSHIGEGWVQLQKRDDGLYVDNRKVILYLSERQQNGKTVNGYELRDELTGKPVLNANILDALLAHPQMIPKEWKKDENGKTRYIFFWATVYREQGDGLFVRYLNWGGDRWYSYHSWFDHQWSSGRPAASLN